MQDISWTDTIINMYNPEATSKLYPDRNIVTFINKNRTLDLDPKKFNWNFQEMEKVVAAFLTK